ncbi:MAG TPA: phytanoyl-CoA dioxygenase family protein [Candidatus Dormibacteraeota bacterium]|nr:phytanoyl-CoA dioxygenase family protein [Candidatus Dormibacteraeota bacterium]
MTAPATDEALGTLDEQGFVVLERLLTGAQLDALREEVLPIAEQGPLGRNPFEGERTHRVYALLAKAESAAPLVEHPRVLDIVDRLLEPNYLLTACQAIHLLPGETPQALHFDDGFYSIPRPRPSVSISTIWAVDDFTARNGATEVIPGSHRWGEGELPEPDDPRAQPVLMPAGSVVVFHGTLWHRGGANRAGAPRCALSPQYCQPWARQQENMILAVGARASRYSERIRALLGYSIHPPFMGFVDGVHPARWIDERYDSASTGAGVESARFWERGGHLTRQ